jgi:hypothetical protein
MTVSKAGRSCVLQHPTAPPAAAYHQLQPIRQVQVFSAVARPTVERIVVSKLIQPPGVPCPADQACRLTPPPPWHVWWLDNHQKLPCTGWCTVMTHGPSAAAVTVMLKSRWVTFPGSFWLVTGSVHDLL